MSPLPLVQYNEMKMEGSDWMVVNLNVSGYYRVNYDMRNWMNLLQILETSHKVPATAFNVLSTSSKLNTNKHCV